jgi:hypothetical protein
MHEPLEHSSALMQDVHVWTGRHTSSFLRCCAVNVNFTVRSCPHHELPTCNSAVTKHKIQHAGIRYATHPRGCSDFVRNTIRYGTIMTCERLRQIRLVLLIHFRTAMTAVRTELESELSKSSLVPRRCGGGRESFNMLARLSSEYDRILRAGK